jgi:hypothetical protein
METETSGDGKPGLVSGTSDNGEFVDLRINSSWIRDHQTVGEGPSDRDACAKPEDGDYRNQEFVGDSQTEN